MTGIDRGATPWFSWTDRFGESGGVGKAAVFVGAVGIWIIGGALSSWGAAGDMVLRLTVTAKGRASLPPVLSDQCEATLTADLLYQPDPTTGRYGRPVRETYTMSASGSGNVLAVENWTYAERQPLAGTASLTFLPSEGKAIIGWSYVDDHIRSEPEAGGGTDRMARTFIKMAEDDLIMKPDAGLVTFAPNAADFTASGSIQGQYADMFGSAEMTATYTLRRQGEELEAVIVPPAGYAGWMPEAGLGAGNPSTNPVVVAAELRIKGTKAPPPVRRARFRFELVEGTKEPGLCLNDPPKSEAKTDFDLQFGKSKGIEPTNENQRYETEDLTTGSAAIVLCYDYGAAARVKVTAITDMGEEIEAVREDRPELRWLDLPEDTNANRIADAWERGEGVWGEIEDAAWDEADDPKDQDGTGDGISLYERYRGFRFGRDHERLVAKKKHVFIHDPDGLVHLNLGSVMNFEAASGLRVRFVDNRTWTGAGTSGSKKRVVNFNTSGFGHAVDQHALHVRLVHSKSPSLPKDFQDMWTAEYGHPSNFNPSKFYGMTYNDVTGVANMESPGGILVIELYSWGIDRISRLFVRYHTLGLSRFAGFDDLPEPDQDRMQGDVSAEVDDYIRTHGSEWEEQNFLYLLAGTSHELGHGVSIEDLAPPHMGGPWPCFMRYIGLDDFPRHADDRMEIAARWHNAAQGPRRFCHDPTATVPGKGCYEQIHVTDRKPPGPALHRSPSAPESEVEPRIAEARWVASSNGTESSLRVEAGLEWEELLAGDPLRFTVRLSWPSMMEAWAIALRAQGSPVSAPPFPAVASTWPDGLRLELARVNADGSREVVTPAGAWSTALRPLAGNPSGWEERTGTRTREFLTDPAQVALTAGTYVLEVAWDGRGRVDPALLPASGVVPGGELRFEVRGAAGERERAVQSYRLAYRAWDRDEFERARQLGQEALALGQGGSGREAMDALRLVAAASLGLRDLRGAFVAWRSLEAVAGVGRDAEVALLAASLADAVGPSMRIGRPASPGGGVDLAVYGQVGQTYEVQVSTDLVTWEPVDRRTASRSAYVVVDPGVATGKVARFYRVGWLP